MINISLVYLVYMSRVQTSIWPTSPDFPALKGSESSTPTDPTGDWPPLREDLVEVREFTTALQLLGPCAVPQGVGMFLIGDGQPTKKKKHFSKRHSLSLSPSSGVRQSWQVKYNQLFRFRGMGHACSSVFMLAVHTEPTLCKTLILIHWIGLGDHRKLAGFYHQNSITYPLVNVYITMENHHF